jgi:hypothetical protein
MHEGGGSFQAENRKQSKMPIKKGAKSMGSYSLISSRKLLATCCGIGLAAGVFAFRAKADEWNKKTILTVNNTIQVQDTVLAPGTYVLKLLDSPSERHVVQIFDQDQHHLIDTVMAMPNYRLQPTGHSRFMFYETPAGTAPALRAWFYPGDNFGQEFRYPKHLKTLETAAVINKQTTQPTVTTEPSADREAPAEVSTQPQAAPPVEQEQTVVQETPQQEQPVEMAQNTPPPAPAAPPAENQSAPSQLPKTASPYPLIGLGGLLSLAMSGLLRVKSSV